jgi:hypothetical protein
MLVVTCFSRCGRFSTGCCDGYIDSVCNAGQGMCPVRAVVVFCSCAGCCIHDRHRVPSSCVANVRSGSDDATENDRVSRPTSATCVEHPCVQVLSNPPTRVWVTCGSAAVLSALARVFPSASFFAVQVHATCVFQGPFMYPAPHRHSGILVPPQYSAHCPHLLFGCEPVRYQRAVLVCFRLVSACGRTNWMESVSSYQIMLL